MAVKKDVSLSKEKLMDRRTFLISSGVAGPGVLFASPDSGHAAEPQYPEIFSWNMGAKDKDFAWEFNINWGTLRLKESMTIESDSPI